MSEQESSSRNESVKTSSAGAAPVGQSAIASSGTNRAGMANLLELRQKIKSRTPKFRRFESWRFVRIHEEWRKPKGVDNHMRLSVKGWPQLVKVGYRTPKQVRYLHPSGYRDILVHNIAELEMLSPERDAARLAAGVGMRKRIEIARRARELGIRVLNGRNLLTAQGEGVTKEQPEEETKKSATEEKKSSSKRKSEERKMMKKKGGRKRKQ